MLFQKISFYGFSNDQIEADKVSIDELLIHIKQTFWLLNQTNLRMMELIESEAGGHHVKAKRTVIGQHFSREKWFRDDRDKWLVTICTIISLAANEWWTDLFWLLLPWRLLKLTGRTSAHLMRVSESTAPSIIRLLLHHVRLTNWSDVYRAREKSIYTSMNILMDCRINWVLSHSS